MQLVSIVAFLSIFRNLFTLLSMVASFIKRQEFVYAPGAVDILLIENFNQSNSGQNNRKDITSINTASSHNPRKKSGQPPIVSIFPKIIIKITSFLNRNAMLHTAGSERREAAAPGVMLEQIRTHLLSRVARLQQHAISLPTVTEMFHPPHMINVIWMYSTQFPLGFQFLKQNKTKVKFAYFFVFIYPFPFVFNCQEVTLHKKIHPSSKMVFSRYL